MSRLNVPKRALFLAVCLVAGWQEVDAAATIAYDVAAGQPGNQTWTGSLGMSFDVLSPILVNALGVFDSGGDGISGTIQVAIFSGLSAQTVTPTLSFTGSGDTLINGSRFQDLSNPVALGVGSYGIIAQGFSANDRNANEVCVTNSHPSCINTAAFSLSATNTGGGLIAFTGRGAFAAEGLGFVFTNEGNGGVNPNAFHAGTFQFASALPPVPEPSTLGLFAAGLGLLAIRFLSRGSIFSWESSHKRAASLEGRR